MFVSTKLGRLNFFLLNNELYAITLCYLITINISTHSHTLPAIFVQHYLLVSE